MARRAQFLQRAHKEAERVDKEGKRMAKERTKFVKEEEERQRREALSRSLKKSMPLRGTRSIPNPPIDRAIQSAHATLSLSS